MASLVGAGGPLQSHGSRSHRQKPMSFFEQILTENGDISRERDAQARGDVQGATAASAAGGAQQPQTALLGGC